MGADDRVRFEVQPHEGLLKRWLNARFPRLRDLDDIVHDAYLRLWKRRGAHEIGSPKAFLFTVARNVAIDRTNAATASPILQVGDLSALEVNADDADGADRACRREEIELVMQAIERLSPRTREVYILRQLERAPQKEIAARLGISVKTVEAHVGRANKHCERFLRDHGLLEDLAP